MTIVSQNSPCAPSRWTWAFCCADEAPLRPAFAALLFVLPWSHALRGTTLLRCSASFFVLGAGLDSFFAAWYSRGLFLILLAAAASCSRSEPREPPLHAQIAEVDLGTRETIQIEAVALGDVDLDSLAYVTGLQTLLFDNPDSQFSATGLASLHRLTNLRHLRLRGHGI